MPIEFVDRVPSKLGRVKITPETGGSAYYAVIERADEPIKVGTALSAQNLNAAQETLVYQNSTSVSTWKRVFIGPSGNDNNTGATTSVPMATVKGVIRKYAKWHKNLDIYVLDGTYTEDIGSIATDNCTIAIRSNSEDKEKVTINMATMLESHINQFRLYNLTLNMTATGVRAMSVNAGMLFANNVRINMPTDSTANLLNVYNGSSVWLMDCVLNAGTGAAIYGNQGLHIRALNCTSEKKLNRGFYAHNGTLIEYTATLNATQMTYETSGGKCIALAARPGTIAGTMGAAEGQYKTFDGLLIQWGQVNITPTAANVATGATVKYPLPFAETPTVVATPVSSAPNAVSVGVTRSGDLVSDNKLEVGIMLVRNGTTATSIYWIAVGKGA